MVRAVAKTTEVELEYFIPLTATFHKSNTDLNSDPIRYTAHTLWGDWQIII